MYANVIDVYGFYTMWFVL